MANSAGSRDALPNRDVAIELGVRRAKHRADAAFAELGSDAEWAMEEFGLIFAGLRMISASDQA